MDNDGMPLRQDRRLNQDDPCVSMVPPFQAARPEFHPLAHRAVRYNGDGRLKDLLIHPQTLATI